MRPTAAECECAQVRSSPSVNVASAGRRRLKSSYLGLFCHLECIVDFDAEVAYRALQLRMTEEQLDSPEILGAPVDQRCLRPPHRVSTVGARVQSDVMNPSIDDACILARGQVG